MTAILKKIRRYLPQIAFVCAVLWLFWQIYPIIFAVHDDMRNYTLVRRGMVLADSIRAAKTGRISHLWNHHLLALPFRANKVWFYKLIQFSALLFDVFSGWKLLKAHVNRQFADLAAVLGVSWACISAYHNLLIAYALCHQIPIGFCFLSLYHFGNRLFAVSFRQPSENPECKGYSSELCISAACGDDLRSICRDAAAVSALGALHAVTQGGFIL